MDSSTKFVVIAFVITNGNALAAGQGFQRGVVTAAYVVARITATNY